MPTDKPADGKSAPQAPFTRWALAATAASIAEAVTIPLDATKVRLQLQGEQGQKLPKHLQTKGMIRTGYNIVKYEGISGLYHGLPAAVVRQAVYGGLGIGLYAPVRKIICGKGDPEQAPIWKRIVAGMITGGTGQAVATPLDVVKVRVQADGRLRALGETPRYTSSFAAFRRIPAEEGIRGMYRGAWASIQRAAVINGCGIASYDYTKHLILRWLGSDDGLQARVLGALTSGLVSATVSTPFDVVKTRLMNQHEGKKLYSGTIDCVKKTVAGEGFLGLYKGFVPAYVRLAPWQIVFFLTFEQLNMLVLGRGL